MVDPPDDSNSLANVRAQIMIRDESTGGWIPLGGGLATVSVRRRPIVSLGTHLPDAQNANIVPDTNNQDNETSSTSPSGARRSPYDYIICGQTTTDFSVIFSCTIKKDFEYHKVMPTFHHWRTGEKKYGLTFQTAGDARAFDKGVRTAVEDLFDGFAEQSSLSDDNCQADSGEDDVFMTLNLPVEPLEPPRPSPTTATSDLSGSRNVVRPPNYRSPCSDLLDPHKPPLHFSNIGGSSGPSIIKMPPPHHPLQSDLANDNYPYVQLTTLNHEYLYPVIDEQQQQQRQGKVNRSNSGGSLKKPDIIVSQPTKGVEGLAMKGNRENLRLRCKHCQELYTEQQNPRGACEYAPDPVRRGIAAVSCLSCAQCMLYHCMSDAEGDFTQNPCSCSTEEGCGRRWFGLALLSLIVPCLWMYPPLRAVHWCGLSCGVCGARHHPAD